MNASGPGRATTHWLPLGRIVGVFGVKGWVKIESYTEPREAILNYPEWQLDKPESGARRIVAGRKHGRQVVASLEHIEDRDSARRLVGATISVQRSALPELKPREYYRADLIGLRVVNEQGLELGRVERFIDAPAHAVMVVRGAGEHWLPVTRQHLRRVDLASGEIRVDWSPPED
ncbi:MAG TPA: ribosome maturation factor RimM [Steroidobacteraceae bacterium]|nr:ribosome maturation factor RimM [Steroidobacteraceae bacterium]